MHCEQTIRRANPWLEQQQRGTTVNSNAWLGKKNVSRRQFLIWGGLGLAGIGVGAGTMGPLMTVLAQEPTPMPTGTPMTMDMPMAGTTASAATLAPLPADGLEIELTAKPDAVAVLAGTPTQVYR